MASSSSQLTKVLILDHTEHEFLTRLLGIHAERLEKLKSLEAQSAYAIVSNLLEALGPEFVK